MSVGKMMMAMMKQFSNGWMMMHPCGLGKSASEIGRSVVSTLYPYRTGFTDTTYMDQQQQDRQAGAKILGNGL